MDMRNSTGTIRGRDLLCFSHDWNGDPLSKTHLMRLLARHNRVLWVNSIGYRAPTASARDLKRAFHKLVAAAAPISEPEPNIHVLSPLAIPAYGRPWARAMNRWALRIQVRHAMSRLRFRRPITWVFNPAAAVVAGSLDEQSLIYYCVDEYAAFAGVASQSLAEMERQLLRRADLVISSSKRLHESKRAGNAPAILVRHGVDYAHFCKALDPATRVPSDLARLPRPIIGYFGLIADDWVDVSLLEHVAQRFPEASIVMLGKITMDVSRLRRLPNVHLLGRKPYDTLPAYCKGFDAALIPFPINEATLNANPLKAREYLAAGLPVISTAIPEVEVLGQCRIGCTHQGFADQVKIALASPGPCPHRSQSMQSESWESRLDEISRHVLAIKPRQSQLRLQAA